MRTREELFEEILREVVGSKAQEAVREVSSDAFNLGWTLALTSLLELAKGNCDIDDLSLTSTLTEILKSVEVDLSNHEGGLYVPGAQRMWLSDVVKALRDKGLSYRIHKVKITEEG